MTVHVQGLLYECECVCSKSRKRKKGECVFDCVRETMCVRDYV